MASGPGFVQSAGFPIQAGVFPAFADGNFVQHALQQDQGQGQGDPNSPETFKSNLDVIYQQFTDLLRISRTVLDGMQNAYHRGNSPTQSQAAIAQLKGHLQMLAEMLRHSGVGALPLVDRASTDPSTVYTETQLESMTKQSIERLYEQLNRSHAAAGAVASLIDAPLHEPVNRMQ